MNKNTNLSEGPVLSVLLKFTFPIFLSLLLQIAYGTADLFIVSHFSGINDVSGVTIGSQLMVTITSFCTGLSMGTTILLGRFIGAKEPEKTTKVVGVSIAMLSAITVFITIMLVCFNNGLASLMQTPEESFSQTTSYLFYSGIGAVFIVFYNLLGSIFRGIGDSKTPLVAVFIACIANILLDLILVAGFNLGATGASIATTVAQGISVAVCVSMIRKRVLPFEFHIKHVRFDLEYMKNIFILGIPVALQATLVSTSFLVMTSIINGFGVVASAAVGIVQKIVVIVMCVPNSFSQALSAFAAQNYGANKLHRARSGLFYAMGLSLVFGICMFYLSWFHGTIFTSIFTNDAETTTQALLYLKSYAIDTILVTMLFSFTGYFTGCGKTTFVMLQCVSGAFLVRIPLAYLFNSFENTNLFLIGLATPSSTVYQIIVCVIFFIFYQKNLKKEGRI